MNYLDSVINCYNEIFLQSCSGKQLWVDYVISVESKDPSSIVDPMLPAYAYPVIETFILQTLFRSDIWGPFYAKDAILSLQSQDASMKAPLFVKTAIGLDILHQLRIWIIRGRW